MPKGQKNFVKATKNPRSKGSGRPFRNYRNRYININSRRPNFRPRVRPTRSTEQFLRMSGSDMIQLKSNSGSQTHVHGVIQSNPLFWKGTRLQTIASAYQKFRPVFLRVRYEPSTPATASGSITHGFVENGISMNSGNLVSVLMNSGGASSNIFQRSTVTMKTKFRDFVYLQGGISAPTSNPFIYYFVITSSYTDPPGILYLDWTFEFRYGVGGGQNVTSIIDELDQNAKDYVIGLGLPPLTFSWGSIIGKLKTIGTKILRDITCVIIDEVTGFLQNIRPGQLGDIDSTHTVDMHVGTMITIDPTDLYNAPVGYLKATDQNGSTCYLRDSTPAVIYMSGPEIENAPQPTPTDFSITAYWSDANYTSVLDYDEDNRIASATVTINLATGIFMMSLNFTNTRKFISMSLISSSRHAPIEIDFKLILPEDVGFLPFSFRFAEGQSTSTFQTPGMTYNANDWMVQIYNHADDKTAWDEIIN